MSRLNIAVVHGLRLTDDCLQYLFATVLVKTADAIDRPQEVFLSTASLHLYSLQMRARSKTNNQCRHDLDRTYIRFHHQCNLCLPTSLLLVTAYVCVI